MGTFVSDTFTLGAGETAGENLSAHVGEVGAHWTALVSGTGQLVVGAPQRVRVGGSTATYWYVQYAPSGAPPSADYTVQADLSVQSVPSVANWIATVNGRMSPDGTSAYKFGYNGNSLAWELRKQVSGTQTVLGSSAHTVTAGEAHTIALVMSGTQISGTVDGVAVVGPLTDSAVSAAGTPGLEIYLDSGFTPADGSGLQFDNLLATTPIAVAVSPSSVSLGPGAPQQFSATVTGSSNQSVSWSVLEGSGGGTITTGGLYTAPLAGGTYHVVATAAADGVSTGQAAVTVVVPTQPSAPHITLATAGGYDTVSVAGASAPGSNAVAGYRLYAGAASGAETSTGVTIAPTAFPAAFPGQPTAPAGGITYYVVRAFDTAAITSAPSNEVYSRTTAQVASGQTQARVFLAPYGASAGGLAATLGYTVYDNEGALLVAHTSGHTSEIGAGTGAGGTGLYCALVSIDAAYSGVLVWDAPPGSGPYVEAFDPGALGQVSGYTSAANPATLLLLNPQNKLLTNPAGQVDLDWSQAIPATAAGLTLGRAALAAIAEGVGVWKYNKAAGTLNEYAEDGTTLLRSFALTVDSAGTITERA